LYFSHGENSVADIFKLLEKKHQPISAKIDVEFTHKPIRQGVMVFDGTGTQVPRPVGVIATERDDAISTNSFLVFGFRPDSSIV
jgi:hypothetical protein